MTRLTVEPSIREIPTPPDGGGAGRTLIACTDVGCTYGTGPNAVVALHSTFCHIRAGDRIAITGPSGSGKSTLLHMLAGLEQPTVGRIDWPGLPDGPRDPLSLGLVFQSPTLIPSLTARENVALPMLVSGVDPEDAAVRAEVALHLLDLSALADTLPQHMSGGQAQRVVIARVLACRPKVILADEPTSQLDRTAGLYMLDVLLAATQQIDAALVIATHDPAISARMWKTWPVQDGRLITETHGGPR